MDHAVRAVVCRGTMNGVAIGYVHLGEGESPERTKSFETSVLDGRIVVRVQVVEASDRATSFKELKRDEHADEAGCARDQYMHAARLDETDPAR